MDSKMLTPFSQTEPAESVEKQFENHKKALQLACNDIAADDLCPYERGLCDSEKCVYCVADRAFQVNRSLVVECWSQYYLRNATDSNNHGAYKLCYPEYAQKMIRGGVQDSKSMCMSNEELKALLHSFFKRLDNLNQQISYINKGIKAIVDIFEDDEESEDPSVQAQVQLRRLLLQDVMFLTDTAKILSDNLSKIRMPVAIKCDYFVNSFRNPQAALDYINPRLDETAILSGTRELFTGLGCSRKVNSYSNLNLFYVEYKLPLVFQGALLELEYSDYV